MRMVSIAIPALCAYVADLLHANGTPVRIARAVAESLALRPVTR